MILAVQGVLKLLLRLAREQDISPHLSYKSQESSIVRAHFYHQVGYLQGQSSVGIHVTRYKTSWYYLHKVLGFYYKIYNLTKRIIDYVLIVCFFFSINASKPFPGIFTNRKKLNFPTQWEQSSQYYRRSSKAAL